MNSLKVLLMVPLISFLKGAPLFPDLGLGYLARALSESGYEVFMQSWNMSPAVRQFKKYLRENAFDIVGIKVFTKDLAAANKTIALIRSVLPDTVIVVGGPHPSSMEAGEAVGEFPGCDFAFRGEAEKGLPLLVRHIQENGKEKTGYLHDIPGLEWHDGEKVCSNPIVLESDIDSFGFPLWDLMTPATYRTPTLPGAPKMSASAPLIVTRGCPGKCAYCSAYKINGKTVRKRSKDSVVGEIELLHSEYNVRSLFFMDTRFTHDADLVAGICEGIMEKQLEITWDFVGYEDLSSLSEQTLRTIRKAGGKFINVGIESGSERVRREINKKGAPSQIFEKIKQINDMGIRVNTFFMIGFPGETKKDIALTADLAFSLPCASVHFEIVCPYPGTRLLSQLKSKYGIDRINWETFDVYRSPYPVSEMDSTELHSLLRKLNRKNRYRRLKKKFLGRMWS